MDTQPIKNRESIRKLFGMNELAELAEKIGALIAESEHQGGVGIRDIPQIVDQCMGEKGNAVFGGFNCYPSDRHDSACHDLAVFVSLQSPLYAKGYNHLTCRDALKTMVQHVKGTCAGQTRNVLFVTDNWDAKAYAEWAGNVLVIQQHVRLEAYLLVGNNMSFLKINT